MNNIPLWANIVIALIGSGLFGGIVSIILSPIAAKQQIKQLETTYHQKLNDNLIQNAQKYIDTLYTPIYKSLSKLDDTYEIYRTQLGILGVMDYADSGKKERMEPSDPEWAFMMQEANHSEHEALIYFV